jgi:sugar lactone lactonase YvrE
MIPAAAARIYLQVEKCAISIQLSHRQLSLCSYSHRLTGGATFLDRVKPLRTSAPLHRFPPRFSSTVESTDSRYPRSRFHIGKLRLRGLFSGFAMALCCAAGVAQSATVFPGTTVVGQTSATVSLTMTMTSSGNATNLVAVTQGVVANDFVVTGSSCAPGAYSVGQTCTVTVAFAPRYPGLRQGAVEFLSSGGGLIGEAFMSGYGKGPLAILAPGDINTVAGDAFWFYNGDGVLATKANIFLPQGVVVDAAGNLFLADTNNNRIRRVDVVTGMISTVGGNGTPGFSGDGGLATQAMLSSPSGMAMDGAGNLYFADNGNSVIRRIDAVTGIITSVAGTGGVQGYDGDGFAATSAHLSLPEGVAIDAAGNLYIADSSNQVVRKVTATTGIITTIAGTGVAGFDKDGQQATTEELNSPWSAAVAADGTLYIADLYNNRVRKLATTGVMTTVAGNGTPGFSGDGAAAFVAELNSPTAMTLDPAGDIYIADSGNNRVREVSATTGYIQTLSGDNSQAIAGDGFAANAASLNGPSALYFDQSGNLFVADLFHNRVREISATKVDLVYPTLKVSKLSNPQIVDVANAGNGDAHLSSPLFNQSQLDAATTTCTVGTAMVSTSVCQLGVVFAPTVIGSPDLGTLTQPSDAPNSPMVIDLSGNVLSVEPTSIALVSDNNPALLGSTVDFTATVAAPDAVTGTVTFYDGSTALCSAVPLTASNTAVCTTATLTLGSHTITAAYSGDADNAAVTSSPLVEQIKQNPNLTLSAGPNPIIVGQSVTLTLKTAPPTGTATGTITFYDGATQIGTAALNGSGVATFTTSTLAAGARNLTAQYGGDATNLAETSNVVIETVNLATTLTTISTSNADVVVGTSITFTSTVVTTNGTIKPTGTVTFLNGGISVGSGTLNASGVATLTLSTLPPGANNIVANYTGDASNATSSSTPLLQTVEQIGTKTSVTSSVNPTSAGATEILTATVTLAPGYTADGPFGGQVTFTSNGVSLGTGPVNASGQATLTTTSLNAGSDQVVATYGGSTNYSTSTSSPLVIMVAQTATTTAVVASAPTITVGQSETFTATVSSPTITPAGTVNFLIGGVQIGSGTLNGSGVATFTTSSLAVGTQTVQAVFVGTANYLTSSSTVSVVVQQSSGTTALVSSVNPQTLGQSVTLTATVNSADPGLTGTVNFLDGATSLGSITLGAGGTAALTTSSLTFGPHTITAVYSGDSNHATSTSTALVERIVQAASVALTSSVNPSASGQNVVFTVKVATVNGLVPTGVVTFSDGATTLGTGALDGTGTTTYATSALVVGSHTISVSYAGDSNYSLATASLVQTVQNASTQIALTASANPATYGVPVVLTAVVSSNGSAATGSVIFTEGGTTLGTATLDATGTAVLSLSTLTPGPHSIVANYAGDGKAGASLSAPLVVVVKEKTTLVLASSENPGATLDAIVLTATVANSGVGTPTGTVTFTDGGTTLGTAQLNASGVATLTLQPLLAGTHALAASYAGDTDDFASVSTLTETVTLRATTTTVSGSENNPNNPQQVTLVGVVRSTLNTAPFPTGTVTFTSGSVVIGSAPVDASGVATINIQLQAPTETVVATYSGDVSYSGSASTPTTITGGPAAQFTVTATPSNPTVVSGDHIVLTVSMASVSTFADTLQMGCLGLPVYATCTFSTPQLKLAAGGTVTTQLTVDTGNPLGSGALASVQQERSSTMMLAFLPAGLLLGLGLFGGKRNRRKLMGLMVLAFAAALTMTATGCSGLQTQHTPPGTYTFTVTAQGTGTGVSESQAVTLTVTAQ